ncbi:MAG: DUF2232 domain-containing protein, partial [Candidatus Subteraquimicrobiales bacterium]|nr:DUF2232 domain-containing protein [Candidatus Subteraquimicrobiales bacterium]
FGMASVLFSRYIASNLYFVGLNFFVVAVFLFFIQGIAVLSHYFEEHKLSKSVKILLYCLAIFVQIVFLGVSFLGLLDTWLNYRKLSRS